MRRSIVFLCCVVLAGCGEQTRARAPIPAPKVELSKADEARWPQGSPRRDAIPVLVYHGIARDAAGQDVTPEQFARQMALLRHAGYQTIGLPAFVAFLRGDPVKLPPRPFLLTFDDGRLDSWTGSDTVLDAYGYEATLFVDAGRVEKRVPGYLTWREVARLKASRRWDVQLESGSGKLMMRYGPGKDDVGPFYAYGGTEEVVNGWRERVFGDISWGERQLKFHVPGYRGLAFSPPYGNYGQLGTNDPALPRLLLERLHQSFAVVFTQDRPPLARRGTGTAAPVGRLLVTRARGERELQALIA